MSLLQMFSYPFMQRALIAGVLVSLCAALLGVTLVLKRYSMIGDGLSHVSFGALAIAVALGVTPLYFSIPVVIVAAFLLLRVADNPRWNSDAAIAAMSVVQRITMFGSSTMIGFGQGFQPVCGFNYGAGLYSRVKAGFWFCVKVSFCFLVCVSVLGFIFAPGLISLFNQIRK